MSHRSWQFLFLILFSLLVIPALAGAFSVESLVVGRRLCDECAEHDTFLGYALQSVSTETLMSGWSGWYEFDIIATHPITEIAANDLPADRWCDENFTNCPQNNVASFTDEIIATDIFSEVYTDGTWIVSTLDISAATTAMDISVNNINYGQHNGLVFNRHRAPSAGTWPQFFVLYANGFIRIKPMGETDAKINDPCFGTSAVLGPYQFAPPLLDGDPHPELHPILDQADIRLAGPADMPALTLTGRFVNSSTTTLINATWLISTTRVDTVETRLNVQQHISGVKTIPLQNISGNGVLGVASLSSMWADTDTHDADVLRITNDNGQVYQISAGDINGICPAQTSAISMTSGYTLSLVTTSPTDHNVGAPDLHIYLKQALLFDRLIYLPIITKS